MNVRIADDLRGDGFAVAQDGRWRGLYPPVMTDFLFVVAGARDLPGRPGRANRGLGGGAGGTPRPWSGVESSKAWRAACSMGGGNEVAGGIEAAPAAIADADEADDLGADADRFAPAGSRGLDIFNIAACTDGLAFQ